MSVGGLIGVNFQVEMMSHFGIRQVLPICHWIGLLDAGYWRQETAETAGREHFTWKEIRYSRVAATFFSIFGYAHG
jgi:hypothetical protein